MKKDIVNGELMISWDKAMLENDIPALKKSVEQVIKLMTDGVFKKQYENLYFLFQSGTKRIEAWGNGLNIDAEKIYCKIFTYAIFWMADRMSEGLYNNYLIEDRTKKKFEEVKQLRKSKYFYPMLELLEVNGELPQGAIAKHLSVSTNALSNFLRRNEKYELWNHVKYGKYNYYHLTSQGKDYLALYQKKEIEKDNNSINTVLIFFMNCLADEMGEAAPDIENILHKMNKKFGKEQAVFGSEADKLAMRRTMRKISNTTRRRERKKMLEMELSKRNYHPYAISKGIIDLDENSYAEVVDYSRMCESENL